MIDSGRHYHHQWHNLLPVHRRPRRQPPPQSFKEICGDGAVKASEPYLPKQTCPSTSTHTGTENPFNPWSLERPRGGDTIMSRLPTSWLPPWNQVG
jgi:hypothetical protein